MLKKYRGSKKSKSEPVEDTSWIVEGIVAYLRSPAWAAPVLNFVEEHCGMFTDSEENSFEHTEIHKKYKKLVEKLVAEYMKELGISEQQFSNACSIRNSQIAKMDSKFEFIWAADDFLLFKRLMIKNNAEIQQEAMRMFHGQYAGAAALGSSMHPPTNPDFTDEDAKKVTKMLKSTKSTFTKEKKLRKQEDEDYNLAIQFSKMEMERLNAVVDEERRLLEEAIRLSLEQSTPQGTTGNAVGHAAISQTSSSSTPRQPQTVKTQQQDPGKDSLTQPIVVRKKYDLPGDFSATSLDGPAAYNAPLQKHSPVPQKSDGATSSSSTKGGLSDLPPLKAQKEVSSSDAASAWLNRAMEEITAEQPSEASQKPDAISQQELAKRRAYLQEQRGKLLALKKQEREKELSEYMEQKQAETSASPEEPKQIDPEQEKQLAARRAVAERLKREVINKK